MNDGSPDSKTSDFALLVINQFVKHNYNLLSAGRRLDPTFAAGDLSQPIPFPYHQTCFSIFI